MRVALNAMQVRAAKSGVGQFIAGLLEALVAENTADEFTVYCTRQNRPNYDLGAPNLIPRVWGLREGWRAARLLNEIAFLPGELSRQGYDVFHGMSNFLPVRRACPYVVTIFDLSYFVHPERCSSVRRRYWHAMTRRTVEMANRIVTCSENSRRDIARFFPHAAGKVTVVPCGVHSRFRVTGTPRQDTAVARRGITQPYLLYVGTLEPGKNVARIIEAFDSVADSFPGHLLLIVGGSGWLTGGIHAAAQGARHSARIRFMGHLPDDEVVDFMNCCEALAFPSLYEGFGLPPVEAMACGAPVVASNTSSLPEVLGDAALLVDPTSVNGIADGLRRVLGDAGLRAELRSRGIERAKLFPYSRVAREMVEVYRSLAGSDRGTR